MRNFKKLPESADVMPAADLAGLTEPRSTLTPSGDGESLSLGAVLFTSQGTPHRSAAHPVRLKRAGRT